MFFGRIIIEFKYNLRQNPPVMAGCDELKMQLVTL